MQKETTARELSLTEEESVALLDLCMTSPNRIDGISQRALRKLAEFCASFDPVEDPDLSPSVNAAGRPSEEGASSAE